MFAFSLQNSSENINLCKLWGKIVGKSKVDRFLDGCQHAYHRIQNWCQNLKILQDKTLSLEYLECTPTLSKPWYKLNLIRTINPYLLFCLILNRLLFKTFSPLIFFNFLIVFISPVFPHMMPFYFIFFLFNSLSRFDLYLFTSPSPSSIFFQLLPLLPPLLLPTPHIARYKNQYCS